MNDSFFGVWRDIRRARKQGLKAIQQRQRKRLAEMVAFARANSPYYRDLYKGLPDHIEDPTMLPVTDKKKLMARFDDWVTDRDVTIEKVRPFVENPDLFGKQFQGQYLVITTSGTTGTRGIFLVDQRSLSVFGSLFLSMLRAWLGARDISRIVKNGGRIGCCLQAAPPPSPGSASPASVRTLGKQ